MKSLLLLIVPFLLSGCLDASSPGYLIENAVDACRSADSKVEYFWINDGYGATVTARCANGQVFQY